MKVRHLFETLNSAIEKAPVGDGRVRGGGFW